MTTLFTGSLIFPRSFEVNIAPRHGSLGFGSGMEKETRALPWKGGVNRHESRLLARSIRLELQRRAT